MKAWLWRGPDDQGLVDVPVPVPAADEILVEVKASGMCGTDLHILSGGYALAAPPLIIGHEFAGVVAAVGDDVDGWTIGDHVAADPNIYCLSCEWCKRGAYSLCTTLHAIGIKVPGAMAEYVRVPARLAVHLPADMPFGMGALIEPLSCVVHGFERGDVAPGQSMAIYGAGTVGLMAVVLAASMGVPVSVVEPHAVRRERALALGAEAALDRLPDGATFDFVLEASGAPAAIADSLDHLRERGTLIQMGVAPTACTIPFNPYLVFEKEWRIIGSYAVADCYVRAAELMPTLADQMAGLITHTLPLGELDVAARLMATPDAVKVQLIP